MEHLNSVQVAVWSADLLARTMMRCLHLMMSCRFLPVDQKDEVSDPHPAPQQLVDPDRALLTVLLPIMPSQLELGYARNQIRTFNRLFNLHSIHEILVVTPPEHLEEISHFYHHTIPAEMTGIDPSLFRVVHDGQCVPEMDPASPM